MRITPLNIVAAMALMAGVLLLLGDDMFASLINKGSTLPLVLFCVLVMAVAFVGDLIFRKMVPSLFRLWFLELALIGLAIVMMAVFKIIFVG